MAQCTSSRVQASPSPMVEADDLMDTDSTASEGPVTSVNGVRQGADVHDLSGTAVAPMDASLIDRKDTGQGKCDNTSVTRKRKRSGNLNSLSVSSRDINTVPLPQELGLPVVSACVAEITEKRQKTEAQSLRPVLSGTTSILKTESSKELYGLNASLWQRTFRFVPPMYLGRLLRVSRKFNTLLTMADGSELHSRPSIPVSPNLETSDSIWAASRRNFAPGLLKPLKGHNELDMWRLLRGNRCQFCSQRKMLITTTNGPEFWQCGPGREGVRVIWPFGIRSCGPCLVDKCDQEISLLCSSTFPSFLLQALPCIFLTQYQDCIFSSSLANRLPPSDIQMTKYFYKPHLEEIKKRFQAVKDLGSGSVEEWIKGLKGEQRDLVQDASRWEQWETKGGLKKVNMKPPLRTTASQRDFVATNTSPATDYLFSNPGFQASTMESSGTQSLEKLTGQTQPQGLISLSATAILPYGSSFGATTPSIHDYKPKPRPERNIQDVNEAKAARRAEIERRCVAMDPPIFPNVLIHMETFQAALQISTPLTDRAWEILQPRLLAQRSEAEARVAALAERTKTLQALANGQGGTEFRSGNASDPSDREWELAQAPVQERLAICADAAISGILAAGNTVTKENAPKLAVDILLSTRSKFCMEPLDPVNTAEEFVRNSSSIACQKLTLENMKWLYDQKVKPLMEHFQKELFLCSGCEANSKFYGFEAVIQHYAAKHTNSLSLGNVVVNWRAEWPNQPPFHPNPSVLRAGVHSVPIPWTSNSGNEARMSIPHSISSHDNVLYSGYNPSYHAATAISSPIYDGTLNPAIPLTHCPPLYLPTASTQPPSGNCSYGFYQDHAGQDPQYQQRFGHVSPPDTVHAGSVAGIPGLGMSFVPGVPNGTTTALPDHHSTHMGNTYNVPFVGTDLYHMQMNEMAKHARDVWFGTSGIKDLPQSVRIYVVVQHVVSRFEQKYTNEPSLSMFIDGLNFNALMRPVRSLNGLSCKTCTMKTDMVSEDPEQSHYTAVDKKLYTLPHLLNHFRTAHVEKSRPTVDLQTGMESSRLDWKYDMIELPDASLIAELINAPGIDDKKIQLIAWVFPGLFADPLPRLGLGSSSRITPRHVEWQGNPIEQEKRQALSPGFRGHASGTIRSVEEYRAQSTTAGVSSAPSPQPPDPPGEDEYDPHRPAYLGRIIESHHLHHPSSGSRPHVLRSVTTPGLSDSSTHQILPPQDSTKRQGEGAYGDQLLRHHDRSGRRIGEQHISGHSQEHDFHDEADLGMNPTKYASSRREKLTEADRFLNDLGSVTKLHEHQQVSEHGLDNSHGPAFPRTHSSTRPTSTSNRVFNWNDPHLKNEHMLQPRFSDIHTRPEVPESDFGHVRMISANEKNQVLGYSNAEYTYPETRSFMNRQWALVPETDDRNYPDRDDPKAFSKHRHTPPGSDYSTSQTHRVSTPVPLGVRHSLVYYEVPRGGTRTASHQDRCHPQPTQIEDRDAGMIKYIYPAENYSDRSNTDSVRKERIEFVPTGARDGSVPSARYGTAYSLMSGTCGDQPVFDRASRTGQLHNGGEPMYYVEPGQMAFTESFASRNSRGHEYGREQGGY